MLKYGRFWLSLKGCLRLFVLILVLPFSSVAWKRGINVEERRAVSWCEGCVSRREDAFLRRREGAISGQERGSHIWTKRGAFCSHLRRGLQSRNSFSGSVLLKQLHWTTQWRANAELIRRRSQNGLSNIAEASGLSQAALSQGAYFGSSWAQ